MLLTLLKEVWVWLEWAGQARLRIYLRSLSNVNGRERRPLSLETSSRLDQYELSHHYEPGRNDASYRRGFWRLVRPAHSRRRNTSRGPTRE